MRLEITSDDCIENAISNMKEDLASGTFIRSFFVIIPEVNDVPAACEDRELAYFNQLETIYDEI